MRRRFIGFEMHERDEQLGEVEPIGRPDAHFAVQVFFVLQAGSEAAGGLGGDTHPPRNGLVGRERCALGRQVQGPRARSRRGPAQGRLDVAHTSR